MTSYLLLENGSRRLLEDGGYRLLEQQDVTPPVGGGGGGGGGIEVGNPSAAVNVAPAIVARPAPILAYSAPQAIAGFDPDNLALDQPTSFRSLSLAGDLYRFYVQVIDPVDTIALLNTNVSEEATIEVVSGKSPQIIDNATPGQIKTLVAPSPARASANLPQRNGYHVLLSLTEPTTFGTWYRITIAGALPMDMLYVEHLVMGLNRRTKNMSVDGNESAVDLGSLDRARDGTIDRQPGIRLRHAEFDISTLEERQYQAMLADLTTCINDPMLVVPNSKAGAYLHDRILYGTFTTSKVAKSAAVRYTRSFAIDSLL